MNPGVGVPAPAVRLLRRWVVDWFNRHDPSACAAFVAPDYALRIGEYVLAGRDDAWLPAVEKQMKLFPGMGMTVHQVIAGTDASGTDHVAAWFTEHGATEGKVACWSGVAIYMSDGERLVGCVAQEDYLTRQRQLKSGMCDPIDPPAPAPWDTPALPRNDCAAAVVRQWLGGSWPTRSAGVRCDDEHITGVPLRFDVVTSEITTLFSAGPDVAFHVRQTGRYRDGLADVEPDAGAESPAVLHCNGIVRVEGGEVRSGRVIRNRLDLRAALRRK